MKPEPHPPHTSRNPHPTPNKAIPDSFDSAENWPECSKVINDIRDQSNCGMFTAYAYESKHISQAFV